MGADEWLGRLREMLEDTTHSLAKRFDAKPSSGEIFVFTPNGDIRKLPEGRLYSTSLSTYTPRWARYASAAR